MPAVLNDLERNILDYMVRYLRTHTYQPSIREIGEEFGIRSTKTVSEYLTALAEKGYLERDPSRSRGIRILGVDLNPHTVSVPCFPEPPPRPGVSSPTGWKPGSRSIVAWGPPAGPGS
jgi:SOS-response transcriptional repressor LexA